MKVVDRTSAFLDTARDDHNLRVILYEMGQHVTHYCADINQDDRMYKLNTDYMDGLGALDIDLMLIYTHDGGHEQATDGTSNCWGYKEGNLDYHQPKYRALRDWVQNNVQ